MKKISQLNKKYSIIYADPPWSYYNDSTAKPNCTTIRGMRRPPYSVMATEAICKLPVSKISAKDCALFIWTTDYHLEKCFQVINSWGFTYKTVGFKWLKLTKQNKPLSFMGAYTKKCGIELCLLATRGNMHQFIKSHKVSSLIKSQREAHSKKPDIVRERIVKLFGNLKKIELFARKKAVTWDAWGDEV